MRLIDADTVVHWQSYDDEHETFPDHEGTIAEFLDSMTDEGCPEAVDAVPVRRGRWIPKFNGNFKGGAYWYECSECRHTVPGGLQSGKIFCENCGADMRKDGDSNG